MKFSGLFQLVNRTSEGGALFRTDARCLTAMILPAVLAAWVCLTMTLPHADAHARMTPRNALVKMLAAMRHVKSIQSAFVCEKKLRILRKPFLSRGIITIARPRKVRFQTLRPYRSCYILHGQNIYMRNESDAHWRSATVDSQPAVGMIMRQFAAWSLGNAEKVAAEYQISMKQALRPMPRIPRGSARTSVRSTESHAVKCILFTLRPRRGVLKQAIKNIQLGFSPHATAKGPATRAGSYRVTFIGIITRNGDQSLFWLRQTRVNIHLKSRCFSPVGPA